MFYFDGCVLVCLLRGAVDWFVDCVCVILTKVSMIKKYHNHKLQKNPLYHEEEPQNIYSNKISERQ